MIWLVEFRGFKCVGRLIAGGKNWYTREPKPSDWAVLWLQVRVQGMQCVAVFQQAPRCARSKRCWCEHQTFTNQHLPD